jgi:hypothetical protein
VSTGSRGRAGQAEKNEGEFRPPYLEKPVDGSKPSVRLGGRGRAGEEGKRGGAVAGP